MDENIKSESFKVILCLEKKLSKENQRGDQIDPPMVIRVKVE
jgi:hypothetical protein